jgi:hypothetical protein
MLYIKMKLWSNIFVCMLTAQEETKQLAPNPACLFLEAWKTTRKGQNSGKLSCV